jgi:hypothetical protein
MASSAAVDKFLQAIETTTIPACDAWSEDATLDATVPNWRLRAEQQPGEPPGCPDSARPNVRLWTTLTSFQYTTTSAHKADIARVPRGPWLRSASSGPCPRLAASGLATGAGQGLMMRS